MDLKTWETILAQSFDDKRISDNEKQAISEWVDPYRSDDQALGVLRAALFRFARENCITPEQGQIIDWLNHTSRLLLPKARKSGDSSSVLFAPEDSIAERIAGLFQDAKISAKICVFTITDDRITDAILSAHKRGIQIRILTDNLKSLDLGSDVDQLENAGIPVVRDHTEAHMHHKFAIFDGNTLANGSYNWTRSAGTLNQENLVITHEAGLILEFDKYFERMWQKLQS